jgi:putative holliday junction resolvase
MTLTKQVTIGLDIGHKRIGVAVGDSIARLAMPLMTLDVTGQEVGELRRLLDEYAASRLVIGLPVRKPCRARRYASIPNNSLHRLVYPSRFRMNR